MDRSNGYEGVAAEFLAGRGGPQYADVAIGVTAVRAWARRLAPGATVIDVGCGSGLPLTKVLIDEGLSVYAIDAAPSFVAAFELRFPGVPVACEPVEESSFFGRRFDGVLSWGLMFQLTSGEQAALVRRFGEIVNPAGRVLFTSPPEAIIWNDAMTGHESRSLGAPEYRRLLREAGMTLLAEYEDEGENHYYDAIKSPR